MDVIQAAQMETLALRGFLALEDHDDPNGN